MNGRIVYLDALRVCATFAVLVLHVAATNFDFVDVRSFAWHVFNGYGAIVRWAVPVFVMMSGALFLDKEIPLRRLFSKYVLKMVLVFTFWSVFYSVIQTRSLKLQAVLEGNFHMWFILMITGLYVCLPVLKAIAAKRSVALYFLALAFVFAYAVPELILISRDFFNGHFRQTFSSLAKNVSTMNMSLVAGYSSYFVLGKILRDVEFSSAQRTLVYALGAGGGVFTAVLNALVSLKTGHPSQNYMQWISVNVLCESVAVFTLFKRMKPCGTAAKKFIATAADCSLGIYLVHIFVLDTFKAHGISTLAFNPALSVPIVALALFAVSFALTFCLKHIPLIRTHLV